MTALIAVLATLLIVAVCALVAVFVVVSRRELGRKADEQIDAALTDRLMAGLYVERVIVTLRSAETFSGLLADMDEKTLMLRETVALAGERKLEVDGEILIPRADVLYMQKP